MIWAIWHRFYAWAFRWHPAYRPRVCAHPLHCDEVGGHCYFEDCPFLDRDPDTKRSHP